MYTTAQCLIYIMTVFPVFGAPSPQTSALPLLFILTVTAIKDGVEDYRRALLDDEVNNSAVTKLGNWRNVNQPKDPRAWYEKDPLEDPRASRRRKEKFDLIGLKGKDENRRKKAGRREGFKL